MNKLESLQVTLTAPGTAGTGTNSEHLFAAAWSACCLSAMITAEWGMHA